MDLVQGRLSGVGHELVLERFDLLAHPFEDDEIVVDDGVDEGIGQVVRPHLPDAALALADPLPDGIEDVPRPLLEGEHEIPAEDDAHLLGGDVGTVRPVFDHFQDDIDGVAEVLHLGPLRCVHDVFEDQGVEAEIGAEPLDDRRVMDAVDVDPGHRGCLPEKETFIDRLDFLLEEIFGVVIDDGDAGSSRPSARRHGPGSGIKPAF